MSKLAQNVAKTTAILDITPSDGRPGPLGDCKKRYSAHADMDDWTAIESLRRGEGKSWREVQEHVDRLLGIETPTTLEIFRYHFRRRCSCWPRELRLS